MSKSNSNIKHSLTMLGDLLELLPLNYHVRVEACNDFKLPADWGFHNRINPNFHIAYIRSGKGSYTFNNHHVEKMEKGKLFFFSSDYRHSRTLDQEQLPHIMLFRFDFINNKNMRSVNNLISPFAFSYTPHHVKYQTLLSMLVQNFRNSSKTYNKNIASMLMSSVLYEILNDLMLLTSKKIIDPRMNKVAAYIENNIERNITVHELCAIADLSKNYFRELFKKQYGITPKEYMINAKIEQSMHLLMETNYLIKDIADMLGYSDQYSFSKQFKEKMGYPPSNIKRNIH